LSPVVDSCPFFSLPHLKDEHNSQPRQTPLGNPTPLSDALTSLPSQSPAFSKAEQKAKLKAEVKGWKNGRGGGTPTQPAPGCQMKNLNLVKL